MADGGGYRHLDVVQDIETENARIGLAAEKNIALLRRLASGSIIRVVSNCESITDFDIEDSGNFDVTAEATKNRTGSSALLLDDAGSTKGKFLTLDVDRRPLREDWTGFNWLCMWVEDVSALRLAGELTIQISNNRNFSSEISVPVCQTADKPEYKCIDITGVARGAVDGFRFVNQRGTGSNEKVVIDEIIVTDMITGVGDGTQAFTGPVRGPCQVWPVASGETLNPGETVNFQAGELTAGVQNDTSLIGVVCQVSPTTSTVATDTALKEVIIAAAGAVVIGRWDGTGGADADNVMLASGNITLDDAQAAFTKFFARAIETGEADADTYVQLAGFGLHS